tara:strand:- start:196 stop:2091 length:1896 start_codon:yes stop_codon:yes gene_type:complete
MKKLLFFLFFIPFISSPQDYNNDLTAIELCTVIQQSNNFSTNAEADYALNKILSVTGLSSNFIIKSCDNINNALAITVKGKRYILYDRLFMRGLSKGGDSYWSNMFILAHEVAHHLNNHTIDWELFKAGIAESKSLEEKRQQELEADEFAGYILGNLGASFIEASLVIASLPPTKTETTHPNPTKRLAAVKKGYEKGKLKILKNTNPEAKVEGETLIFNSWKKTIEYPKAVFNSKSNETNPFNKIKKAENIEERTITIWAEGKKLKNDNTVSSDIPMIYNNNFKNFDFLDQIVAIINISQIGFYPSLSKRIYGSGSNGAEPVYTGVITKRFGFPFEKRLGHFNSNRAPLGVSKKGKKVSDILWDLINSYVYSGKPFPKYSSGGSSNPSITELSTNRCLPEFGCEWIHRNESYRPPTHNGYEGESWQEYKRKGGEFSDGLWKVNKYNLTAFHHSNFMCSLYIKINFEILVDEKIINYDTFLGYGTFLRMLKNRTNDELIDLSKTLVKKTEKKDQAYDKDDGKNAMYIFESYDGSSTRNTTITNILRNELINNRELIDSESSFFIRMSGLEFIFFGQSPKDYTRFNPKSRQRDFTANPRDYPSYTNIYNIDVDVSNNPTYYQFSLDGLLEVLD